MSGGGGVGAGVGIGVGTGVGTGVGAGELQVAPVKPVEQVQVHPVLLLPVTELAWLLQLELVVQVW